MKRSTAVALVISGTLVGGCNRRHQSAGTDWSTATNNYQVVTNDTYIPGRGYYHSHFHGWYPFPYNYYDAGRGYYRGGSYYPEPDLAVRPPTVPGRSWSSEATKTRSSGVAEEHVNRGGFTRSRSFSSSS